MHLSSLVDMIESGFDDRLLLGGPDDRLTGSELAARVRSAASMIANRYPAVVFVGENHPLLPIVLLAAGWAGVPFVPVNYRLEDRQLRSLVERTPGALVLTDESSWSRLDNPSSTLDAWLRSLPSGGTSLEPAVDDDTVAVVLYTSGTTAEPKAALLRHRHLMAYLLDTVEFGAADADEAALIAVPPYHVAGVANLLSNLFAGRRVVYMRGFDPITWLTTVRSEAVTNAMVVPTMLARIVDAIDGDDASTPTLRALSYGGAPMSERVLRAALRLFPNAGFVNAYGLTETASTIAILAPEDHRAALTSSDPVVQRRLGSVGKVLPSVTIEIRDDAGNVVAPGEAGMLHARGDQIAGEYATGSALDADGWFCTRDRGWIDRDGYLFIEGRADDTIIRGGENIAPAEIESVLHSHPAVAEACVVGVPDEEWGQRIVAMVVMQPGRHVAEEELRALVHAQLRSSRTPDRVVFADTLPRTDTGKVLRRLVADRLR